jgi:hypothetical protein
VRSRSHPTRKPFAAHRFAPQSPKSEGRLALTSGHYKSVHLSLSAIDPKVPVENDCFVASGSQANAVGVESPAHHRDFRFDTKKIQAL